MKTPLPIRPSKVFDPNRFTPDEKKPKVEKPIYNLKQATAKKKKPTGEKQLFEDVWLKRPHRSEISGEPLGDEAFPFMFLHVLPKAQNRYPLFKLYAKNIVLGTFDEHKIWDTARHLATGEKWKKMFALEAELKKEYSRLTPKK